MSFDLHHIDLHHLVGDFFRPGGGQSYSGSRSSGGGGGGYHSSSSGGSSSGGGGGALVYLLFQLVFRYPQVGVPLLIIVVVVFILRARANAQATRTGWASQNLSSVAFQAAEEEQPVAATTGVPRRALDRIRETDPDFSIVLFEDFLYTLYGEMMRARGQQGAMALAAYLSPAVQQVLAANRSSRSPGS